MLTSPAVRIAEIFERAFAARGLEPIYPEAMDRLLYCIKALKANNRDDAPRATLREIAAELRATGADVLLVACSEFSIIVDTIPRDIPVVDTIDVLAAAVIAFASGAARGDPVADEIMIAANAVDPRGDASIKEGRLRLREEI